MELDTNTNADGVLIASVTFSCQSSFKWKSREVSNLCVYGSYIVGSWWLDIVVWFVCSWYACKWWMCEALTGIFLYVSLYTCSLQLVEANVETYNLHIIKNNLQDRWFSLKLPFCYHCIFKFPPTNILRNKHTYIMIVLYFLWRNLCWFWKKKL